VAKTERAMEKGLAVKRYFTSQGKHPYDEIEWDVRDAIIPNYKEGGNAFEQRAVEFPSLWSLNATNIVAQKYFRGPLGSPQRESSVRQLIDRVADTITAWGWKDGYFAAEDDRQIFNAELKHILVTQKAAFNSPVWFNVGSEEHPQCSACQPGDALISTPGGMIPIGEIVKRDMVGLSVFDSSGETKVVATKDNGIKPVYRILLRNGAFVEATGDHVVRAVGERRTRPAWYRVDELVSGMRMHLHPHRGTTQPPAATEAEVSEAALAGWLQADGFVGQYETGTNRSLTIEFFIANADEEVWVKEHLDVVFPNAHRKVRPVDGNPGMNRIRLYGEHLREFVERWELLNRRHDIRVPVVLWTASKEASRAYLRSVFQSDGFVGRNNGSTRIGFAVISERWTEDVQNLLLRHGIYSRRFHKVEKREDRSDIWEVGVSYRSERKRFHEEIGFIGFDKSERLRDSLALVGKDCPDIREEEIVEIILLGDQQVFDIQTESGEYLTNNIVVHNCFILAVDDKMSSILNWYVEEGTIFKGGSGSGINLSSIRSSKEKLSSGGEASGPVSFMRGADASAGTIKSGGKCFRRGTLVATPDGLRPVEDLKIGDPVLTDAGPRAVLDFMPNGVKQCYRVRTVEGYEVEVTTGHKFAYWDADAGEFGVKPIEEFSPGDALYVLVEPSLEGRTIELRAAERNDSRHATMIEEMDFPAVLTDKLAYMLGLIYGDGELRETIPHRVRVAFAKDAAGYLSAERFVKYGLELFGEEPLLLGDYDGYQVLGYTRKRLVEFLAANSFAKGKGDALGFPTQLFRAPAEQRAAFAAGLIDADGTYQVRGGWSISSIDRDFLVQMQRLLLSLGVPSKLTLNREARGAWKPLYRLHVAGSTFVRRLTDWIAPHSAKAEHNYVPSDGADKETLSSTVQVRLDSIEATVEDETYDIEVADVHLLSANGLYASNTRRAAKMVILNVDHPDVEDFVWCKAVEERKARVLRDNGFDMDLDGSDSHSIQYQNANNSVRVTDEFMQAYLNDADWDLKAVQTGETVEQVRARHLMRQIAQAAWECADPGMQYDTTINDWHTCPASGRINASNPCCFIGETLVVTEFGSISIEIIEKMARAGEQLPRVLTRDLQSGKSRFTVVSNAWIAGEAEELVVVRTRSGQRFECTPEHRFLSNDQWIEAQNLQAGMALTAFDSDGKEVQDAVADVARLCPEEPVPVFDLEIADTHNFVVTGDGPASTGVVVHNSEYMHLDNSACNLASLNLMKFLDADLNFDIQAFRHAIDIVFLAQEILVSNSSYPTEKIGKNAEDYRELGLGYANLGALLMSRGVPYDSEAGRAWAGAITALMTGWAYRVSAQVAEKQGPYNGYPPNREAHLRVMRKHRAAVDDIDPELVPEGLLQAAKGSWDDAITFGEQHGYRNSQATVLAPTGCLVGGSLVPTERGLVRLRSLGDPDGAKWQDLGIDVATDDGVRRATQFYVNGSEPVVDVRTRRGYRIQGTTTHRIKVVEPSGAWVWKRFADLTEGDRVPLALDSLVGRPQVVTLPPLGEGYWTGEHHVRVPDRVTSELAELVGYFMGDGSLHSRGLRFCVAAEDFDVVEHLTRLGKSLFGIEAAVTDKQGYVEVAFHSVRLVQWWQACGFAKYARPDGKPGKGWLPHVPDAILHSNDRETYAAFLRGLYEADGTVTAGAPSWSTTSLEFSQDVQSLMLAMGYPTTRKFDTTGWGRSRLVVLRHANSSRNERWLEEIGFLSGRKNARVTMPAASQSGKKDRIPMLREMIDRLAPENDRLRRVLLMESGRSGSVSRAVAEQLQERVGDDELGHLLGFFYDEIASAELGEEELTYDLSVPDNVTYVANGFVSHNTIGLMMDCDTTGIEPDLALVKTKKLVGGGTMRIVNQTVPRALTRLGYDPQQVEEITAYIHEHNMVHDAPHVRPEHYPVFDCAMGEHTIHYMGHVKMMAGVQPFISGAISKCVTGETLLTTEDGLIRIASLHDGEEPDSYREHRMLVASLGGQQKAESFYFGGVRPVRQIRLRSGQRIVGTPNHRVLVAADGELQWRYLDEIAAGEYVATQYGADMWASVPPSLTGFAASPAYGNQRKVSIPAEMTGDLAFLLGAYAAEGHTTPSNWTITITNADEAVLAKVVSAWRTVFGVEARIDRQPERCPGVVVSSKTIVEFFDWLGCGHRASAKRIPDLILRSPKQMVLAFLQGLWLEPYTARMGSTPKWAICLDSPAMLDDLQAVLTNLGIVHSRIEKYNKEYGKSYGEVYAVGEQAMALIRTVPFVESDKRERAEGRLEATPAQSTADVVPGVAPRELYNMIPRGRLGRNGYGFRKEFSFLLDRRTRRVSRRTLERVAQIPGVALPEWLRTVLSDGLHFSPVESVADAGEREVYDIAVPSTEAFVANGIVNHNTVNMPESATVEEVEDLLAEGWRLGLKALALYRDNCKVAQPLSADKKQTAAPAAAAEPVDAPKTLADRKRLPKSRPSRTISFRVGDQEGYMTAGMYPDDGVGEVFLKVSKQGSTVSGVMDALAIAVSIGLQYGVPLEAYVSKFINMRFEPLGMTDDADIRMAQSLVDYIFRRLAIEFLPEEVRADLGIRTTEERKDEVAGKAQQPMQIASAPAPTSAPVQPDMPSVKAADAPYCYNCGNQMRPAGSCFVCEACGSTSGCS